MTDTRTRFLTAANELFRRHGYNGSSIKQITEVAGATIGSLYHHFPGGKVELTAAVVEQTGRAYRDLFELIAADAPDAPSTVGSFFDAAADVLEQTDFLDLCPIGTIARETASTEDRLREASDVAFASWVDALRARLVAHGVDASLAHDLAATAIATLEGCFVLARTSRDATILRRSGKHLGALMEQSTNARP